MPARHPFIVIVRDSSSLGLQPGRTSDGRIFVEFTVSGSPSLHLSVNFLQQQSKQNVRNRLVTDRGKIRNSSSSGSSGRVRGGGEKHEIYAVIFGGLLFYDFFHRARGAMDPWTPRSATEFC